MSKGVLVIGGSGFADRLKGTPRQVETPFGRVDLLVSQIGDKMVHAIKRHGELVGMTAPIEAILARELGIPYSVVAIGTNWAAGISQTRLTHTEVEQVMHEKGEELFRLLSKAIERL